MTGKDKFKLVKALRDARMMNYGPHIKQQFDACVNMVSDVACKTYEEHHHFRALVYRDNWLPQDNPFKDDNGIGTTT